MAGADLPGGTTVRNEITLDLCGGGYASENERVARLQIALKRGQVLISSEIVEYRDSGAQAAFREIQRRLETCPPGPVREPEAGHARVRWHLTSMPRRHGWVKDAVEIRATQHFGGRTITTVSIYQSMNDWLAAVYTTNDSAASLQAARKAATIEAGKLRRLATAGTTG